MQQRVLVGGRLASAVGLGAMPLAIAQRPEEAAAIRVVRAAVDAGMNWIDVADSYCLNENDVGYGERLVARALADAPGLRESVLVATKGGYVRPGGEWKLDGRPKHLKSACEASLKALGVSSIELYQLHGPDPNVYFPDSVGALAELREQGKIQHVGLCNVDVGHLQDAARIVSIASVQNRTNLYDRQCFANGVIDWCERRGIAFIAHSPVGGHRGHVRIAEDPALAAIARRHEKTPYQIAIAWLLASSGTAFVIPGASRAASAQSSAAAADIVLTKQDFSDIERSFPQATLLVKQLVRARRKARHLIRNLKARVRRQDPRL